MDASEVGVAKAAALAKQQGVEMTTLHADLNEYQPQPESMDVIAAIYAHLPALLRIKTHRACVAALKPGGLFVLEAFHPNQLGRSSGGPGNLDLLYDVESIVDDLAVLKFLEAQSGLTWLDEGRHDCEGYVTRVVAQRA